ncbi:MAG: SurA N-terminal domain-containing protein [Candidatus Macondimonas sp.]
MMQFIRERSKGLLSFLLIGFISLTFALWGINSYFTGSQNNAVAKVGARNITADEFSRFYQQQYRQLQSLYGDAFRPEMIDEAQFKIKVLDAMIADAALRQHLIQNRMIISDSQLAEAINQLPTFQQEGKFSSESYQQWLRSRGYSSAAFESELRGSMLTEQMRMAVRNTAFVTHADLQEVVRLNNQQRNVAVIALPLASLTSQVAASDDEIKDFYIKNAQDFQTPDRIRVSYVLIRRDALANQLQPNDTVLRERYAAEGKRFSTPERRHVSHILLKDEAAAQALAGRLGEAPKKFQDFARELSEDSGSAVKGGELGWVEPGMLPLSLDQAVYSAKPGEPVGPIKSSEGYHWLLVDAIEAGKQEAFDAVRSKLAEEYQNERLAERWNTLVESVETVSFENASSLQPIADLAGVQVQTTNWFTREAGDAPANSPRFRQASFSDDVFKEGLNSEVIKLDEGTIAVLRLEEHQPAKTPPLDQVKAQVKQALQRARAAEIADQKIKEAEEAVDRGEAPAQIASKIKGNYRELGWIERQGNNNLPPELVDKVFSAPHPQDEQAAHVAVTIPNGDRTLVLVRQVKDGDLKAVETNTVTQIRERVSEMRGEQELAIYLSALKKSMDIKTYPDRL